MIGKTISHYRIIEKIGQGGMGDVYRAEDTQLKRTVAIKFLPAELHRNEEAQKRFVNEAQAASALDHDNIGTIYEIDETGEQPFMAMAYYGGRTLNDRIREGVISIEDALKIALQISKGLSKAHTKKIIHRDIKPANIVFTEDNEVKIIDFGLAKLIDNTQLTQAETTLGTVSYMSPEQSFGTKIDHRTDIWSLGVILYEVLAGECPFKGEYEQAIIYSIVNEDPEFISGVRADVPLQIEKIINKALEKNPDKRYQSMDEMSKALESALVEIGEGRSKKVSVFRLPRKHLKLVYRLLPVIVILIGVFTYLWLTT
ncbi:MAG: serine/threonine protein kinase, partial [Candidatus Heimdallarchaeota archaeon]|nr:serine/threonine protein kinase [Candidatus Heimdallarchaeota archaeon]